MVHPWRFRMLAVVIVVTLVSVGIVQGLWTERWVSRSASQEELVAEMERIPLRLGAWAGKAEKSAHLPKDEANNYAVRRYVNEEDGTVATVMLTRGRPGPLVFKHLPTECYPSNGYELAKQPAVFRSQGDDTSVLDDFLMATFKKPSEVPPISVQVYWSWSGDGQWQVPDRPRMAFSSFPVLYKLYVVRTVVSDNEEFEGAPVHGLIRELTKAMRQSFFTKSP